MITQPRDTHPQSLHFWEEDKQQLSVPRFEKTQNQPYTTIRLVAAFASVLSGIAPSSPFCPALYRVHPTQLDVLGQPEFTEY